MVVVTLYAKQKKRHRCTEQTFGLWEKARVGCFERTASKHVYYLGWGTSPSQVGCMRQVLRPGALGRPRGIGWRGRWKGGSGWGIHVNPWLIHVHVWQKPLQYCKVISFQLIKINEKNYIVEFIINKNNKRTKAVKRNEGGKGFTFVKQCNIGNICKIVWRQMTMVKEEYLNNENLYRSKIM